MELRPKIDEDEETLDESSKSKGHVDNSMGMNKAKPKDKIYMGCRCYERLQPNTKEFTRLTYTELVLELEHLKIETRLITELCDFIIKVNRELKRV